MRVKAGVHRARVGLVAVVPAALVVAEREGLRHGARAGERGKLPRHVRRRGPRQQEQVEHAGLGQPLRAHAAGRVLHVHIHLGRVQPAGRARVVVSPWPLRARPARPQQPRRRRWRGRAVPGGSTGGRHGRRTRRRPRRGLAAAPTAAGWSRRGRRASRRCTRRRPGCTAGTARRSRYRPALRAPGASAGLAGAACGHAARRPPQRPSGAAERLAGRADGGRQR